MEKGQTATPAAATQQEKSKMFDDSIFNNEHYSDPTAYKGMQPIVAEERARIKHKARDLISTVRFIVHECGFEITSFEIKHKETGRSFR